MKSRRTTKCRIEQRTADRKNARRRKRPSFRLEANKTIKVVKEAIAQAKEN